MAGFMNISDHLYIGTLKAAADVKPGTFVNANFGAGTATVPVDNAAADGVVYFVTNTPNTIDEELIADTDFAVKNGQYLRLKAPKVGDILTTDQIIPTYAGINVGDTLTIGAAGKVDVVAARTPKLKAVVKEKLTLHGVNALKLVVTQA